MLRESRKTIQPTGNGAEINQSTPHYSGNVVSTRLLKLACPSGLRRIHLASAQVPAKEHLFEVRFEGCALFTAGGKLISTVGEHRVQEPRHTAALGWEESHL